MAAAQAREDERAEDSADQTADMPADRDAGDGKAEHQVDHDQGQRGAAEDVVALSLEDQRGPEQAEERPGGADGRYVRRYHERAGRAGEGRDDVQHDETAAPECLL